MDNLLKWLGLAIALAFLAPLAWLNGLAHLDHEVHLAAVLAFAFVVHIWIRPGWGELAAAAAAGGLFVMLNGSPHSPLGPLYTGIVYAGFLGLGSLIVLGVQTARLKGEAKQRRQCALTSGLLSPIAMILIGFPLRLSAVMHPQTFDTVLYAYDQSLGFEPSYLMGQWFGRIRPVSEVSAIVYNTLPLAVAFFYPALMLQKKRFRVNVILLFTLALLVGSLLYNLCPAAGPRYAFPGTFPDHAPQPGTYVIGARAVADAPRNAIPSLHLAMALLIFWNAHAWGRRGRIVAGFYLTFTILATLGFGEHYLIDLVVGVPFTLAAQAAFTIGKPLSDPGRRFALAAGGSLTLGWMIWLRFGLAGHAPAPLWSWSAMILTLAVCWMGKRRLDSLYQPAAELREAAMLAEYQLD